MFIRNVLESYLDRKEKELGGGGDRQKKKEKEKKNKETREKGKKRKEKWETPKRKREEGEKETREKERKEKKSGELQKEREKKMGEEVAGNLRRMKNFRTKSSYGVPLAYLLIWITNDIFNLVGCVLEPITELIQLCSVSSTSVATQSG